jgi:hypothetical protein
MATRSSIATEKDGKKVVIYCHWDGYLSNNGNILLKHYKTQKKVDELLVLGNISSLKEKVKPRKNQKHSFDKPAKNVTVAYHRDRGEKFAQIDARMSNRQEFNYLFKDGVWYYNRNDQVSWVELYEVTER